MAGSGSIYKRCGCRHMATRKRLEQHCPRLPERGHGTWHFACSATDAFGRPARARRGGFRSKAAACQARDEWLTQTGEERTAQGWTLERWLRYWLSTRTKIKDTTRAQYARDVEQFLIPHMGRITLAELNIRRIRSGFDDIAQTTNGRGQPQSPSCLQHLRTTLRAALNLAVREGLLDANPIRHLELPSYRKPHAQVWTPARVAEWRATGRRPSVAVWTAPHLAAFLDAVTPDRLFALWWLIALRGLRRGEACGLRWTDLDLDHGVLFIFRSRTVVGYRIIEESPKRPPARAPSLSTSTPWPCSANTCAASVSNRPPARRQARPATTAATCSSAPTAGRCTPSTPRGSSPDSSSGPTSHRSGFTTSATARRPSRTKPAPISRPCKIYSVTRASSPLPTPTPASCRMPSVSAPRPPPGWFSPQPAEPAKRSGRGAEATAPTPARKTSAPPAKQR